jgi:hypothetical protein
MVTITHAKTNAIADPTQADLDRQIALGNYPVGTTLADITLSSDWNDDHIITGSFGDVTGAASSTDNALARFDSTTGKLIQNSNAILEDDGELTLTATGTGQVNLFTLTGNPGSGASNVIGFEVRNTNATSNKVSFYLGGGAAGGTYNRAWGFGTDAAGSGAQTIYFYNGATGATPFYMAGDLAMFTGTIIPTSNGARLQVQTTTSTVVGLTVTGAASQSANLQEWRDSTAAVLASVSAIGTVNSTGLRLSTVTKTADYTATLADHTIRMDATSGNRTVTLPAASTCSGLILVIKLISATNTVTIEGNASETLDGALNIVINTQYALSKIQSNGTNWDVIL